MVTSMVGEIRQCIKLLAFTVRIKSRHFETYIIYRLHYFVFEKLLVNTIRNRM